MQESEQSEKHNSRQVDKPILLSKNPKKPEPREIGGVAGPEPTRYGDWEKNGRCVDF